MERRIRPRTISGARAGPPVQSLLTILFTDIEDSTALTQKLGDARAQAEIVRTHNAFVREALTARGGSEIKHTGDGIMGTFPSATAAVSCAIAIRKASAAHNHDHPEAAFNVRIGLNAGEPVAEEGDVYGTAVQLARRICDQAGPGQILASDVVRQLVAGKGLLFDSRGDIDLKGFALSVSLYEVRAEADAGDQLWQEAVAQRTESGRRPRLVAGAALLSIGAVTALLISLVALSGGSNGTGPGPAYREIRVQGESSGQMDVIRGDCVTSDIIFRGVNGEAQITGDVAGTATSSSFEARVRAATRCRSLSLTYSTIYSLAGPDGFIIRGAGYSRRPLIGIDLDQLAGVTDVNDRGVVYGGTGVYRGIAGKSSCESVGLRAGTVIGPRVGYEASNNCTLLIAPAAELPPITLSNAWDATIITTQGGASGLNDTLAVTAVYHNNRDVPLTGLRLQVPMPDGVRFTGASVGAPQVGGVVSWSLPDLPADGVGTFRFSIRLVSSEADKITITPEMIGDDLEGPVLGDAISLAVAR
jgi:class 3 adenylate cyclase